MTLKASSVLLRYISSHIKVAKLDGVYDHSSTQIDLPSDISGKIMGWGKQHIPQDMVHDDGDNTSGYEDDIHVTLLYGLKDDGPEKVRAVLEDVDPFDVRLGLVTAFRDKDEYDVIKIDVESPMMHKLHYKMEKLLENDNSYATYQPHVTVAYVKKGIADDLIGDDTFKGYTFMADKVCFSGAGDSKDRIYIPLGKNIT